MEESRISVSITADRLSAEVTIAPGPPAEEMDLRAALTAAGIRISIDEQVCRALGTQLEDPEYEVEATMVAKGDPGIEGEDGKLKLHFPEGKCAGLERTDGSMDFRERFLVHTATEGGRLATYHPATKGREGRTVEGQTIEHKDGKDCMPRLGKGVTKPEGSQDLIATRSGIICFIEGESLSVLDLHEHEGDVDYDSGNLHLNGSAVIAGDICQNFSVSTEGDAVVKTGVCAGTIHSEANVAISGGVTGGLEGDEIVAKGDITCHHASRARMRCGKTLRVEDHSMDSYLNATCIRMDNGRGKFVGGVAKARESIRIVEAGSSGATKTELVVADLSEEIAGQREQRRQELQQEQEDRAGGPQGLILEDSLAEEGTRRLGWVELELLKSAEIVITGIVHPGVVIRFSEFKHDILEELRNVRFTFDEETQAIRMDHLD